MRRVIAPATSLLPLALAGCFQNADQRDAFTGTWTPVAVNYGSRDATVTAYKFDDGVLEMQSSDGKTFAAPIDGTEVPVRGAPPGTAVSVKRIPAVAFQQVFKRNGQIVGVRAVTVVDEQVSATFEGETSRITRVYAATKG